MFVACKPNVPDDIGMRIALGLLLVCACSDSSPTILNDAAPDAFDTNRCLIMGDYGALGSLTGTRAMTATATTATMTLDPGPPRDTFFVKLEPNRGVFASGVMPGTYTIGGVDAGFSTCGLCVNIVADIVSGVGPTKFYFADSGSVTLTSTTTPVAGSAQNVHLREVDISSGEFVTNGCEATIASVSFTAN
jgi:hypothetical protein